MDQDRTQAQSRPTIVSYGKTRVSVIDGPDRGLSCETAGRPIRIGTAADNDLVLSDPTVSRRHCAIVPTSEGFRVSDEGSTNGVLVGRMRIFEAVLDGSSDLRIGESTVSVRCPLGWSALDQCSGPRGPRHGRHRRQQDQR